MHTRPNEIKTNIVKDAYLAGMPFTLESAKELALDLKANTSIENLDIGLSSITDEEFTVIADALVSRKTNLNKLNLNYSDITYKSFESVQSLMMNGKVKLFTIFGCDNLLEDSKLMEKLEKCAIDHGVKISSENPLKLEQKLILFQSKKAKKEHSVKEEKEHTTQLIEIESKNSPTPRS